MDPSMKGLQNATRINEDIEGFGVGGNVAIWKGQKDYCAIQTDGRRTILKDVWCKVVTGHVPGMLFAFHLEQESKGAKIFSDTITTWDFDILMAARSFLIDVS